MFRRAAHWPALRGAPFTGAASPLSTFPLLHCLYTDCNRTTCGVAGAPAGCSFHFQAATTSGSAAAPEEAIGASAEEQQHQQQHSVQKNKRDEIALRFPLSLEQRWDEVYCSDLCLQLDRLILSCASAEEVLRIVASHRGAFFVKNLVSALKHLAALALQPNSSTSACSSDKQQGHSSSTEPAAAPPASPFSQLSFQLPSPPTWPQEPLSVFHFFSTLSGDEAAVERSLSQRIEAESIVRDPRQVVFVVAAAIVAAAVVADVAAASVAATAVLSVLASMSSIAHHSCNNLPPARCRLYCCCSCCFCCRSCCCCCCSFSLLFYLPCASLHLAAFSSFVWALSACTSPELVIPPLHIFPLYFISSYSLFLRDLYIRLMLHLVFWQPSITNFFMVLLRLKRRLPRR